MYDALGSKINTISETDMMEELVNLAVEENITVVEIIAVMESIYFPTVISEKNPANQPSAHKSQAHSSPDHSSQTQRSPAHISTTHSSSAHSSTAHSKSKKIAVEQLPAHSSPAKQSSNPQPMHWGFTEKISMAMLQGEVPRRSASTQYLPEDQHRPGTR